MRILLVNDYPPGPTGGAEVHVGRLRDALAAVGDEVELFTAEGEHQGVGRLFDLWDPSARSRLRRRITTFEPDVIHYHNILNELSTSVLGLGPPSVLTVHDARVLGSRIGLDRTSHPLSPAPVMRSAKNALARTRLRRCIHATIAPSEDLADALTGAAFPCVHHVPNFAAPASASEPGSDVLYVGQLSEHKGPDVLLQAFESLAACHPGVRLRFVGSGPMLGALRERAETAGLSQRVVFEGRIEPAEVASRISVAAVVVVPSVGAEGHPLALIDAMASGRPVVVSDQPGLRDVVDDHVGAVVPSGDAVALASAIDALLADRAGLVRRADAARTIAERWSRDAVVPQLRAVYGTVLRDAR